MFSGQEVRKQIAKLSHDIIGALSIIGITHESQEKIAALVKKRCEDFANLS